MSRNVPRNTEPYLATVMRERYYPALIAVLALSVALAAWRLWPKEAQSVPPRVESLSESTILIVEGPAPDVAPASEPAVGSGSAAPSAKSNTGANPPAEPVPAPVEDSRDDREALARAGRLNLAGQSAASEEVAARVRELQPTQDELARMGSAEILVEIAGSPLTVSIAHLALSGLDRQISGLSAHLGVEELYSRPDGAPALLETYREYTASLEDPEAAGEDRAGAFEFAALEVMMGADAMLDQYEASGELPAVMESVLNSLGRRAAVDAAQPEPVFGQLTDDIAATVVGRCLERLQEPAFIAWLGADDRDRLLGERSPTPEESQEILEMARDALGSGTISTVRGSAADETSPGAP